MGAIADLIKEGKIRYGGISNFTLDQLKRVQAIHPVASSQPVYSMLLRDIETEMLDYCAANDIGVIPYSPMQSGLLTGKFTREHIEACPRWTGAGASAPSRSRISLPIWLLSTNCVLSRRDMAARWGSLPSRGRCGAPGSPPSSSARDDPQANRRIGARWRLGIAR